MISDSSHKIIGMQNIFIEFGQENLTSVHILFLMLKNWPKFDAMTFKHIRWGCFSLMLLLAIQACKPGGNTSQEAGPLRIAASANMRNALEDLVVPFQLAHDQEVQITTASSGQLFSQIQHGAPYDLFLSADTIFPHELHQQGYTSLPPKIYAQGKLILWSMEHLEVAGGLNALKEPIFKKIAMANPETAPYGKAAKEAMINEGVWEEVQAKIVLGESVGQTNHFIFSKAVDAGLTSLSATKGGESKDKGIFIFINQDLYSPIYQGMALLKRKNGNPAAALRFWNYMYSDTAQSILALHGYETDF